MRRDKTLGIYKTKASRNKITEILNTPNILKKTNKKLLFSHRILLFAPRNDIFVLNDS